jgi:hypothetical protein
VVAEGCCRGEDCYRGEDPSAGEDETERPGATLPDVRGLGVLGAAGEVGGPGIDGGEPERGKLGRITIGGTPFPAGP